MNNSIVRFSLFALCAAAIAAAPLSLRAQSTNKHAEKKPAKTAKSSVIPFHGKLKAVDKTAKTISVGESVIQVTSETKISKEDKPAVLDDGAIGETVSGAYKKTDDGRLVATMVHFGAKADKAKPEKTTKPKKSTEDKM